MQVSVDVLVEVAGSAFHALSRAQIQGPCRPTRVLPRGDDLVPAKEKAQNVAPQFPPGLGCDLLPVVLHGS